MKAQRHGNWGMCGEAACFQDGWVTELRFIEVYRGKVVWSQTEKSWVPWQRTGSRQRDPGCSMLRWGTENNNLEENGWGQWGPLGNHCLGAGWRRCWPESGCGSGNRGEDPKIVPWLPGPPGYPLVNGHEQTRGLEPALRVLTWVTGSETAQLLGKTKV